MKILILIVIILLITSVAMGCFEDNGNKKSNKAPIADAGGDITILSKVPVHFNGANSTDKDGKITGYSWEFDDYRTPGEQTSSEMNPVYIYNYPGEYSVTLTVTDNDDATSSDDILVKVLNRAPLVHVGDNISVKTYELIYFNGTANDEDGYITDYAWDFDNDSRIDWRASALGMTTHFYTKPGIYNTKFTVTDDFGDTASATKIIEVTEVVKFPPIADAGVNQSVPIGEVLLKGSGFDPDGTIVLFEWDFDGDGTFDWNSDKSGIVDVNYTQEGMYNAKLRVTDDSGLFDVDQVVITVNKSLIQYYTNAEVYIDWNNTHDYIIVTNTTINSSHFRVIISDISTNIDIEYGILEFNQVTESEIRISSKLKPKPGHTLEVQVLYYDTLIGARVLEIVNQSQELLNPDIDFSAVYDYDQIQTEVDRGEVDLIRVTSIGELVYEQKGDLIYSSIHGTGEYYVLEESDDGQTEITVECDDLWINNTYSKGRLVTRTLSLTGQGTMVANYEDNMDLNIDIKVMRLVMENGVDLVNYVYGDGTFSGSGTDPSSGTEISASGNVYITNELIGRGKQINYLGTEFDCSIYYSNLTLDGTTGPVIGGLGVRFKSTIINTTWNVNFEKYSNNTVYYEYESYSKIANLEYDSSGSGHPLNSPLVREYVVHITEAMSFETPRPKILVGQDSVVLSSKHDVKLKLTAVSAVQVKIGKERFDCVDVDGLIINGGSGSITLRLIATGTFTGVSVSIDQDVVWKNESLKLKQSLKQIKQINARS